MTISADEKSITDGNGKCKLNLIQIFSVVNSLLTNHASLHYNHLHRVTVKRVSTDAEASQREGVASAAYRPGGAAERLLCGRSGTCLGVLCEVCDGSHVKTKPAVGQESECYIYGIAGVDDTLCAVWQDETWRMSALAAGKMDAGCINQGGTAGFPVPLGLEIRLFSCCLSLMKCQYPVCSIRQSVIGCFSVSAVDN